MIDYDKFEKSLKHLELQYNNFLTLGNRPDLGLLDKDAIAESTIHRFETCYDTLWKILKRYLTEEMGVADMPNSPKPVFQIAFENKLLNDVAAWKHYADTRTYTSHDYSGQKATAALGLIGEFVTDATALYSELTGKQWV